MLPGMALFTKSSVPFGPRARWLYAVAATLFVGGLFMDGWAHLHVPELETFFTVWHAIFYAGFLLTACTLVGETLRRKKRSPTWRAAVPAGQALTLLGCAVFALGGVGDMLWHVVFGVEADIEALLSPTHLLLAIGLFLIVTGGIRDQWARGEDAYRGNLFSSLPYVLSIACAFAGIVFLVQFGEFTDFGFAKEWEPTSGALRFYQQANPILGAILFSSILTGTFATLLRRGRLPFGAVTLVLGLAVVGLSVNRGGTAYVPAALLAGLVGDTLLESAEWSRNRVRWLRLFCTLLPFSLYAFMMTTLTVVKGTWLTVHMWTGIPVLAALAGTLASTLAFGGADE